MANLLGYAVFVNSVTIYLSRRRGGVKGGASSPSGIAA